MKLEIHNGLAPTIIEATRVVIKDMYDNPIVVAVEIEHGIILAETASEDHMRDFTALLTSLGITKTAVITDVKQKTLPEIRG